MGMSSAYSSHDDGEYKPLAEINVTPFVDVMLVLLIIFMVAAPLMVQGVPVELPKTSATKLGQVKKPMVVTLSADGNLYIRDEQVPRGSLVTRLMAIKSQEGGDGVVYVTPIKKSLTAMSWKFLAASAKVALPAFHCCLNRHRHPRRHRKITKVMRAS